MLLSVSLLPMLLESIFSYKILVFSPRLAHSHINFMGTIADVLVEAGHEITIFMPDLNPDVSNNGSKLAKILRKTFSNTSNQILKKNSARDKWKKKGNSILQVYRLFQRLADSQRLMCQEHLEDDNLMSWLQIEQYDLGITEQISFCGYAIFNRIGLNNQVTAGAITLMEVFSDPFGVSSNPSYVPGGFSSKADRMNYLERLTNIIIYTTSYILTKFVWEPAVQSLQYNLCNKFNYIETMKDSSLYFVNTDELLDFPRLVSNKIVFIGGIAVAKPTALTEDYQQFMDYSEHGVILVSFGTVVRSEYMSNDEKKIFEDAFRQFPEITFLWKYENENEEREGAYLSNVVKKKWIPQNDILNHHNLLAFISHCGQNSFMESVSAGVPLICIPLFGDQFRNAKTAENRNVAIILNKEHLTTNALASALKTIIYEESYRKNVQKLKEMIKHKPISAKERLIRNIEFIIKHGPIDNFNVAGIELNIFQYFLIDVLLVIIPFISLVIYLSSSIASYIFFLLCSVLKIPVYFLLSNERVNARKSDVKNKL